MSQASDACGVATTRRQFIHTFYGAFEIITEVDGSYRGLQAADGAAFTTGDILADLKALLGVATTRRLAEGVQHGDDSSRLPTDALTDRAMAWVGQALTKAVVKPVEGTEKVMATVPPFRRFGGLAKSEAAALDGLREEPIEHARAELCAGRDLHTWDAPPPVVTPEVKGLVRLSTLRLLLKQRAAQWGAERRLLPAHAEARCLADIDALVTRHAMQMQGVTPPQEGNHPPCPKPHAPSSKPQAPSLSRPD